MGRIGIIGEGCEECILHRAGEDPALRGVSLLGSSRLVPPYEMARSRPGFSLILGTLAGRGRLWTAAGIRDLSPGTVFLGDSTCAHRYRIAADTWHIVWAHCQPGSAWHRERAGDLRTVAVADQLELDRALRAAARAGDRTDRPRLRRAWYAVIAGLLDVCAGREGGDPGAVDLAVVWREVEGDLARPWCLNDLCRLAHRSPTHLHRLCRRLHGTSPMRRIADLRLCRGRELVLQSDLGLRAIAAAVGYANEFAFSAAYKRHWGQAPALDRGDQMASLSDPRAMS